MSETLSTAQEMVGLATSWAAQAASELPNVMLQDARLDSTPRSAWLTEARMIWSSYSDLTVSSLLKYEVAISEHVGFSAHGRPERGESAGKPTTPGAADPRGAAGASWVL